MASYFGKYRATVINNIDPEMRGRLQVMVPDVLGLVPSTCLLYTSPSPRDGLLSRMPSSA